MGKAIMSAGDDTCSHTPNRVPVEEMSRSGAPITPSVEIQRGTSRDRYMIVAKQKALTAGKLRLEEHQPGHSSALLVAAGADQGHGALDPDPLRRPPALASTSLIAVDGSEPTTDSAEQQRWSQPFDSIAPTAART